MKQNKKSNRDHNDYYDDEDDYRPAKKKDSPRRRPVRNWKKAWVEHQEDWEEVIDFRIK